MKKSNFALRLQPSLMEEAKKVAKAEGVAVNQLINVAVAEKVSANRGTQFGRRGRETAEDQSDDCEDLRANSAIRTSVPTRDLRLHVLPTKHC